MCYTCYVFGGAFMNYKLIASDLDGTLLYDVFTVSGENYRAIEEYTKMGGNLVPASGRSFYSITKELRECKDIRYFISSNGAVVSDNKTGERDEVLISNELFEKLMNLTLEYETFHTLHFDGFNFMLKENDSEEKAAYYNLNKYYYIHYHKTCKMLEKWEGAFSHGNGVEMASIFFRSQEELDECVERINALGGLLVTSSADFNIEVMATGASKGDGVRRLAKKLGIPIEETIGVGDSRNDMALLDGVGLPLAVSNATDALKAKAAKIICSHREHIIRYILDNIIE